MFFLTQTPLATKWELQAFRSSMSQKQKLKEIVKGFHQHPQRQTFAAAIHDKHQNLTQNLPWKETTKTIDMFCLRTQV